VLQKQGHKRMFLHAWRLQFNHPVTAERVALQADLPPELQQHIDQSRPHD
jgi:23S rRNA pseudouridine955/2504/2580 synthase